MSGSQVRYVALRVLQHGDEAATILGGPQTPEGKLAQWLYQEVGFPQGEFKTLGDRVDGLIRLGLRKGYSEFRPNLIAAIGAKQ